MRRVTIAGLLATLALAPQARADFVITGSPPPATDPAPADALPTGIREGGAASGAGSEDDGNKPPARPKPVHFNTANGFGHQVPLRFAVRQIVPNAVHVSYGRGADPAAPVDWKGGDTWNHVLRDAVEPLGLHLVMTNMAVEIRK